MYAGSEVAGFASFGNDKMRPESIVDGFVIMDRCVDFVGVGIVIGDLQVFNVFATEEALTRKHRKIILSPWKWLIERAH